jgi:phage gp29-like protein
MGLKEKLQGLLGGGTWSQPGPTAAAAGAGPAPVYVIPAARAVETSTGGVVSRAADRRRAAGNVKGWTGTKRFSLLGLDDPNADVSGRNALVVADKMRRTDGQVRAIQSVIGLPIRASHWYVEPPKGASPAEHEAAQLLDDELMGGMLSSFDDVLREILRAVYLGVAVPEIEWEEREGRIAVRNIWPRNPELIESWLYDGRGTVVGYLYAGNRVTGAGVKDSAPTTTYERVAVPLYRCIHAAYEPENGNPWGNGLWRAMYPHWSWKHSAYLLLGIGLERNFLGAPYATASEGALPEDRELVEETLRLFRTTEDGCFVMPYGWEVDWLEARGDLDKAMPLVNHHDALMARAALAQFLNLGQTTTGTQSLASEHVKLFLEAEDAIARWIGETFTRTLVRQWCMLNYGPGFRCPKLRHRAIRGWSLEVMARALQMLTTGDLLTPGAEDEEHIRVLAELPEVPIEQLKKRRGERESKARKEPDAGQGRPEQGDDGDDVGGDDEGL